MVRRDAAQRSLFCCACSVHGSIHGVGNGVLPIFCVHPGGQYAKVVFPGQWVALFVHQLDVGARQFVALPLGRVGVGFYAPVPTQGDWQVGVAHPFCVAAQGGGSAAALLGRGVAGFGVNGRVQVF